MLMIFWVNACNSFTLENIRWKNMRFCLGSVRIDSTLALEQTPATHRRPPRGTEPEESLHLNLPSACGHKALKPDSYLCRVILCTVEKRSPTSPCNSSIFISQITQAGRVWWEIFIFPQEIKNLGFGAVCVLSTLEHSQPSGTEPAPNVALMDTALWAVTSGT